MSERTAARLAWALAALAIALVAVTATLLVLNWSFVEGSSDLNLIELILPVGFAGVGAIVASRRPSSPIGWLFLAIAVIGAVPGITNQYLLRDLRSSAATLPLTPWMAWLQEWVVSLIFPAGAVMFVFLLFPDGRLLSPRSHLKFGGLCTSGVPNPPNVGAGGGAAGGRSGPQRGLDQGVSVAGGSMGRWNRTVPSPDSSPGSTA